MSEPAAPAPDWTRGGVSILAGRTGDALLRLGLFAATARVLTPAQFSVYALVTAALGTLQNLLAFGGPRTAAYFQTRAPRSAVAGWLLGVAGTASLALLGVLALVPPARVALFPEISARLLLLGLLPLPCLLLSDSFSAILLAERRERLYSRFLWLRSAATGAVLAGSLLVSDRLEWLLVGRLAISVLIVLALVRALEMRPSVRGLRGFAPAAARFALPLAGSGAIGSTHRRADVFLLSAFEQTSQIGPYAVAYAFGEAFWTITDSLEAALFVDLARHADERARREAFRAARVYAAISVAALALGLPGGLLVIRWFFSARYPAAASLFPWIFVAAVFSGIGRPFSAYLVSRGEGPRVLLCGMLSTAVNLTLCILWIPAGGALGAARATLVSYVLGTLLTCSLVLRRRPR
ncbi:MAG: oligosaccharide flippase family protein [Acidobacteriota bacterium]